MQAVMAAPQGAIVVCSFIPSGTDMTGQIKAVYEGFLAALRQIVQVQERAEPAELPKEPTKEPPKEEAEDDFPEPGSFEPDEEDLYTEETAREEEEATPQKLHSACLSVVNSREGAMVASALCRYHTGGTNMAELYNNKPRMAAMIRDLNDYKNGKKDRIFRKIKDLMKDPPRPTSVPTRKVRA